MMTKSNSHSRSEELPASKERNVNTHGEFTQQIIRLIPSRNNGPLQWTTKSVRKLTGDILAAGYGVNRNSVSQELKRLGFRLNRNRELSAMRKECDVDSQFEIANKAVSTRLESGSPILLLIGDRAEHSERRIRRETSFVPPFEIAKIDENFEPDIAYLPDGSPIPSARARSAKEKKEIQRQKREATTLDLDILTTERDGSLFTAAVLKHWWDNGRELLFPQGDSLLILTHGRSPDYTSPIVWQWAMNKLSRKLGITITIGRLPPAIWRFRFAQQTLFSFTWLQFRKTDREGFAFGEKDIKGMFTVKCNLLGKSHCQCDEIKNIPLIGKSFPKLRRSISKRVQETFSIHRDPPYGDWNYSFERPGEQR